MSYQHVGLRISRDPGAVPNTAQLDEGELAFNLADRRVFARFGNEILDITDKYTREQVDKLVESLSQRLDALAIGDIAGLWDALASKANKADLGSMATRNILVAQRAPSPSDGTNGDVWFQY